MISSNIKLKHEHTREEVYTQVQQNMKIAGTDWGLLNDEELGRLLDTYDPMID